MQIEKLLLINLINGMSKCQEKILLKIISYKRASAELFKFSAIVPAGFALLLSL